jgi:hypothetical protein
MDPEKLSIVMLLRFLDFGAAADQYVYNLINGKHLSLNPAIENAAHIIASRINNYTNTHMFYPSEEKQQEIFENVAREKNLFALTTSEIIIKSPAMSSYPG